MPTSWSSWDSRLDREFTALGLVEESSRLGLVLSRNHDLYSAQSVEGEAVGVAEGLAVGGGGDVVGGEEGPHLGFIELALGGVDDDQVFIHDNHGSTRSD